MGYPVMFIRIRICLLVMFHLLYLQRRVGVFLCPKNY
jgi:hypothetical protein